MSAPVIAQAAGRGNNFDLLRLLAATAVVFSHSFGLVTQGGRADADPLYRLTNGQMTFGELGVYIFFIASGFLITASLQHASSLSSYFIKRLLRIGPGLAFVLLFSMLVIGPLLTTLPLPHYLAHPDTLGYLRNLGLFIAQPGLPGVYADNPLPSMVNGSLWTLKFEVFCYLAVALIGWRRRLDPANMAALALACTVAAQLYHGPGHGYLFYLSYFLAGAALYLGRARVPVSARLFCLALGLLVAAALLGRLQAMFALAGSYCVICLAYMGDWGARMRRRMGDYSYGIYLFGFPVQQAVVALLGTGISWYQNFLVSMPVILLLAMLSWRMVEEPALALRERLKASADKSARLPGQAR